MTITADFFHNAWKTARHHETAIMEKRPAAMPRGAWRDENPAPETFWRLISDGASFSASLEVTIPVLKIATNAKRPKLVAQIDLRGAGADEALKAYDWPAPGDMTNYEFAAIRARLGLTQAQLAGVLDLAANTQIAAYESEMSGRNVPKHLARLMRAYDAGWRPSDWPKPKA